MKRLVALVAVAAIGLAGCSTSPTSSPSSSPTSSSAASGAGLVNVVASTNVYGDIVKTIGGPAVAVTSIIDNPERICTSMRPMRGPSSRCRRRS